MILRFLFFYLDLLKHCKALSTEKCRCYMNIFIYLFIIIVVISNGNRTEWSPIRSVIIQVIRFV